MSQVKLPKIFIRLIKPGFAETAECCETVDLALKIRCDMWQFYKFAGSQLQTVG